MIIHVDMDAFYASIEQNDYPEYRNRPVIVGADPVNGYGRGVVSTCSYEARKFGIHSAMPISKAYKLCPTGIFIKPRMKRYTEVSAQIINIFSNTTPTVEQISIDEAFLDISGLYKLLGTPLEIANKIKKDIYRETGLTASIGIASNKSIAKIASDLKKPDGITICPEGNEKNFISTLPVSKLWGVGKKTHETLLKYGFKTIGDISSQKPGVFIGLFGKMGESIWYLANGIDNRLVNGNISQCKSISEEHTFMIDCDNDEVILDILFKITDKITRELRIKKLLCKTIQLKIRLENFETYTRSYTFYDPNNSTKKVYNEIIKLYNNFEKNSKVRLIGASLSNLSDEKDIEKQLGLFHYSNEIVNSKNDIILDNLKEKYGKKIIRARILKTYK